MNNLSALDIFDTIESINIQRTKIDNLLTIEDIDKVKLIDIILNLYELLPTTSISSINKLELYILNLIKDFNNNLLDGYYNSFRRNIDLLFDEIITDFKYNTNLINNLKLFFYSESDTNTITSRFLNYPVHFIERKEELDSISRSKKNKSSNFNILISSCEYNIDNKFFDKIYNYTKVSTLFFRMSEEIYKKHYYYNYLKHCLMYSAADNVDTITVGNSYTLLGIDTDILNLDAKSLSMHSQDLYYSFMMAKTAITNNPNINKCIIGICPFLFYHDLSKGTKKPSETMISQLYYPLLNDIHNSKIKNFKKLTSLADYEFDNILKDIFNLKLVENFFKQTLYANYPSYYNHLRNVNRNTSFAELDLAERQSVGFVRAGAHNKLLKYPSTKEYNTNVFNNFMNFLKQNSVIPIFVAFPQTSWYSDHLSEPYAKEFDELILDLTQKHNFHVLNLQKEPYIFDDSDFIDSDHLNAKGQKKATNYLNDFISNINL